MTIYDIILWFFAFALFGYVFECIVLSVENRTIIKNRGFVHSPFCIIYGFGALGARLLFAKIPDNVLVIYISSLIVATTMELITANAMKRLFGMLWWDYSNKSYNYKGIICLESSMAWGFLGIFFAVFLSGFMENIVMKIPENWRKEISIMLLGVYVFDFLYTFVKVRRTPPDLDEMAGRLKLL
jgi:Predicted membrane protein